MFDWGSSQYDTASETFSRFGPPLNVEVQSMNGEVGVCCAALISYGCVKDSECFSGFDT